MKIYGKEYTEVKDRIPLLLETYPDASIETVIFWHKDDFSAVCVRATICIPAKDQVSQNRYFTGLAYEERVGGETQVNATSWVENAETSAIGRALANANIGVNGNRPSAEEMQKVERMKKSSLYEELANSLDYVVQSGKVETVQAWAGINKEKAGKLSPAEKKTLGEAYNKAIAKLEGK